MEDQTATETLEYNRDEVIRFGRGTGGVANHFQFLVKQEPDLPIAKKGVSDIYDYSFQFLCSIARGHTLIDMIRRTFQSRINNPISRVFIGYPLEPSGRVFIC